MSEGKIVAVTGASRGIGSAIVEELARRGHTVGCLSRKGRGPEDREVSPPVAERFINITCDITDEEGVKAALKELSERAGRIDALVNNAGILIEKNIVDISTAEFENIITTNLTGVFVMCREVYPYLIEAGGGMIVNIGSYYERLGVRQHSAYNAAKAGVGALTRCMAVEWARKGIRVLDVAPGIIITDINRKHLEADGFRKFLRNHVPVGESGTPEQVGKLVASLLGEDLPFFTGETIHIDGGQSISV